tara:strand:- start:1870 stop:2022 length:153 start_codon:yes stop_codon:yes gene_type:complete
MNLRLMKDKKYKGFFYAKIEIDNISYDSSIVKSYNDWKEYAQKNNLKIQK